jgi:hypothetical protein
MLRELFTQALAILQVFFSKSVIILSSILGVFLSLIGYPKQIILVIVILVVVDLITKHYSLVKINYQEFTLHTYILAWKQRVLKSRLMKNHICVKTFLYSIVFFVANQCEVIPQIIGGSAIASILYTGLLLTEASSIFENFVEAGNTEMLPFLKFFKKKTEEVFNEEKDDSKEEN